MKKTILGVVLSMFLLLPVWAAGQQASGEEGTVSLTWLAGVWANQVDPEGYFKETAKQALNIDLTLNIMPSAQLGQKAQVLVAGGDYPEILMLHQGPNALYKQWAEQGLFVQLDQYWGDYPSLVKGFPEEITLTPCRVDGELYMIPVLLQASRFNLAIRSDWLQAVGKDIPTNIDELYDVARAFRELDPDGDGQKNTYGFGMDKLGGTVTGYVNPAFGIPGGFTEYYLTSSGQVAPNFMHPNIKASLAFLKKCYQEEILYPDSVTKIYAEQENDFLSGKTGLMLGNNGKASFHEDQLQENFPNGTIVFADPLMSSDGTRIWQFASPVWRGNVITQKAGTEVKIRAAMSLMDWMVGAGNEIRQFGPEGVYWTNRGSHGKPLLVDEGAEQWGRKGDGYSEIDLMIRPYETESWISPDLWADEEKVAVQIQAFERYEPYAVFDPTVGITTPTMTEVGATLAEIIRTGVFEIIIGGEPVSYLDSVIAEWRSKGGSKMLDEINAEYKKMH